MRPQPSVWSAVAALVAAGSAVAQPSDYDPPRTEHGHPDFQGVWSAVFLTPIERPPLAEGLVAAPEQAAAMSLAARTQFPDVIDPDVDLNGATSLAEVGGEFRTSIIVDPADGLMPYSAAGEELAAWVERRNFTMFNGPEIRPEMERCLGSFGHPPMRGFLSDVPRQIIQTRDHVVIYTEDPEGLRILALNVSTPPDALRSRGGFSTASWQGDTLVVETTHFSGADPARLVIGRPLLVGAETRVEERFTRASDTELLYQFTVYDQTLYTQPWSGEFSLTTSEGPVFEYACHEANYSMANVLLGGRAEAARRAAPGEAGER